VLNFCKFTFSWGDYIAEVWDHWILEGNLLVLTIKDIPVGICHSFLTGPNEIWIEGIRVDKNFRKKGFATIMIKESEIFAKKNNCKVAKMLIETKNTKSIKLAEGLNYKNKEKWDFFSLIPKKIHFSKDVRYAKKDEVINHLNKKTLYYVRSWRWIPLTTPIISNLVKDNNILIVSENDSINGFVILTESDHFEKTLMVTLYSGSKDVLREILSFIQNFSFLNNYKRIQILTKLTSIPKREGLEKKLSFFLMEKFL